LQDLLLRWQKKEIHKEHSWGICLGKQPLERSKRRLEENISLEITEIRCEDLKLTELTQIKPNGTLLYQQGSNSSTRKLIRQLFLNLLYTAVC
jgi:hypothetical protein